MKRKIEKRTRSTRFWINDLRYQFWCDVTKFGDKLSDCAARRMEKALDKRFEVLKESVIDCSDSIRGDVRRICKETSL